MKLCKDCIWVLIKDKHEDGHFCTKNTEGISEINGKPFQRDLMPCRIKREIHGDKCWEAN